MRQFEAMGRDMNSAAFRQLIEDVRARTDIVALIRGDIRLKPCGSVVKGRSPFNKDRDPSFVVWPDTQTWWDYSGGGSTGGDCFEYIMRRDNVGFMDALKQLAISAGIELPGFDTAAARKELRRIANLRIIQEILTSAAAYYHSALPSEIRKTWCNDRYGFTDETIDSLLLGWADGNLFKHMAAGHEFSKRQLLRTGLFVQLSDSSIKDFFQNRLVFPYWARGRVAYFIARATNHTSPIPHEKAKYKKLLTHSKRHSYVSPHVANDTFYNEDSANGAKELLVTEGVTDCISAMQAGVACISPVTTRFRSRDHQKLIKLTRHAKKVIICNDTETSGAGEKGALETAQILYSAGKNVRLATIPLLKDKDKIDINELVTTQGPDALRRVLSKAKRLPEFMIDRIPATTPKTDLPEQLEPVIELIRTADPIEQEAYLELLQQRFKLRAATIKALLHKPQQKQIAQEEGTATSGARKGEVFEAKDHYYTHGRRGEHIVISSFLIEPRQRIVVENGEIIEADIVTDKGHVHRNTRFGRDAWYSKRHLLKTLKPVDLQWTGSDEIVHGVLRLVAMRDVPTRKGTLNLGYLETAHGPRWVSPDGLLTPLGVKTNTGDLVYVPSGASLHRRVCYKKPRSRLAEGRAASVILPKLLELNTPEVVLPIIGWFFAAPLKPRISKIMGHFPTLFIWGSQGSGKSSMVMEVFWQLFGVTSAEPYSATETEFALLKLLSATNSVPVFIDEYKPFDMPRKRRNMLHRYIRRLYMGEVEERGRADQTLVTYKLSAPLCIAGETRPIEPALVERILTSNPDKNQLLLEPKHAKAFGCIKTLNPNLLSASIIEFLLARNTDSDLDIAAKATNRLLAGREVPHRIKDNITVMMLGLHHYTEYAKHLWIQLPELQFEPTINNLLEDLLESGGTAVKSSLDYFLEELSIMAINDTLKRGCHYTYKEDLLVLHFPSCHAAFSEHCRRSGFEGEVPGRKALRRQLVENQHRGGYVKDIDSLVYMGSGYDRRRAVLIDIEEAKRTLTVDGFPSSDSDAHEDY